VTTIVAALAPRLLGPALMVAAALIVKGYTDVGDGFSAAVVVALAVALQYVAVGAEQTEAALPALRRAPAAAVGGLLAALATGFFGVLVGDPPFTHQPPPGEAPVKVGTLELITAVAFDLALFVLVASLLVMLVGALARVRPGDES
jgi:multisubunit Na+/H+ antiporter MnhB subunit